MKLSKTQLEVLRLMVENWELGLSRGGINSRYWMQKGGLGYGGEAKNINANTAYALYKKGLIKGNMNKSSFPTLHYRLTEKGKKVVEEEDKLRNLKKEIKDLTIGE